MKTIAKAAKVRCERCGNCGWRTEGSALCEQPQLNFFLSTNKCAETGGYCTLWKPDDLEGDDQGD
jgi:hypothetical protein